MIHLAHMAAVAVVVVAGWAIRHIGRGRLRQGVQAGLEQRGLMVLHTPVVVAEPSLISFILLGAAPYTRRRHQFRPLRVGEGKGALTILVLVQDNNQQVDRQIRVEALAEERVTIRMPRMGVRGLLLSATQVHNAAQAAQLLPLVGTPTTRSLLPGHSQHEPLCPN
jgi:hypothetical protein